MLEIENKIPKILAITVSSWNSKVGSNTWPTLLEQYGKDNVANICLREERPDSNVCSRYFVVSENRVLKSVLDRRIKTGREITPEFVKEDKSEDLDEHNKRYQKMKKKRRYSMLLGRELVWMLGKWCTKELDDFLDSFKPDVIVYSMEGYIHLNRIIEYSIKRTGASSVGYFWDDNFTYKQSTKIGHRVYRFFQRKSLKKLAGMTNSFFAISSMTKREADEFFGVNCRILTKPLNNLPLVNREEINMPIRMLYTGNLLIGRDRSLFKIVSAIDRLSDAPFTLDVYTQTILTDEKKHALEESGVCKIHAPIPQSEVLEKQKAADILLFLEDIDGPDAHTARLSFSTKITDYLSSGKSIFAVGCRETAPMQYFIENDAAIVASSDEEIFNALSLILASPNQLNDYAERARDTGIRNHSKEIILGVFDETIKEVIKGR